MPDALTLPATDDGGPDSHDAGPATRGAATLTDVAYVQLEELITTLQLPPGAFLSELALAERLSIGRTPIREALQRLARDGLVVVIPRRGILVSEINLRSQLRLLETRRVLEALLARLAAERADSKERARFSEIGAAMRAASAASDDIEFMRLDREFNLLVAAAARNEFAVRSISTMTALSRRFWYQHYKEVGDLPLSARLHAEVCDAIAHGDGAAAAAASDRLMDYIESFARKTLDV
ncbi:GntR family transcriptional regulator [Hansschlegelia zhihuaiae]|uniref:GntR family transcriptional regulator n=1 Tax=Hansschlegelia zhihuaiae TaxID=405005 RepID=A0A4Q0MM92_9HYPH|nr:GntR family transcriptional regulator [Hansschlegelia zhihuaiae]RXF74206.1 GntR family transcriptional regulator [Hansschlegelia zhihuaiae]